LRRQHAALSIGASELLDSADETLVYRRTHHGEEFVVALNLGSRNRPCDFSGSERVERVLASTLGDGERCDRLRPDEGLILLLRAEC
jgi:Domain of unknown function (DUF3459)